MKTRQLLLLATAFACLLEVGAAQSIVATPPAGYFTVVARGGSDTALSLPLVRRSMFIGRLASVTANSLTSSDGNWAASEFAPANGASYYAQFVSGALAGVNYKIVNNTADTLTLATFGDDLTNHPVGQITTGAAGDIVRIRRFWTVAEVFGNTPGDVLVDTVDDLSGAIYRESDLLLFPDNVLAGTQKKPLWAAGFVTGTGWRLQGEPLTDAGALELWPGVPFTLRRHASSSVEAIILGYVATERVALRVPALAAGEASDIAVAPAYPTPLNLSSSGLSSVVEASSSFEGAGDLVFTFSEIRFGVSQPFEDRLYRTTVGWYLGETPANDYVLRAGSGYVLRLKGERPVRYWVQQPPN